MQSGRVAPVDNSRKEERKRGEGKEKGEKEGGGKEKGEKEGKRKKRSPLTMGSRDFGPLTS